MPKVPDVITAKTVAYQCLRKTACGGMLRRNAKLGGLAHPREDPYNVSGMVDNQDEREADEDNARSRSAPRSPTTLHGWKKWLRIVFALFFTVGGFATLANLYLEVRAGRGGELHRSMWGYKVSPIGILVVAGATAVVFPAISVIQWLLHLRYRAWERKHPRKPP